MLGGMFAGHDQSGTTDVFSTLNKILPDLSILLLQMLQSDWLLLFTMIILMTT